MKNLLISLIFILFITPIFAQKTITPKKEIKGDLTEVTIYYNNGEIMQKGSYDKDGKLHGLWESFNKNGSKKCLAYYNYNVKTGTWIYWNKNEITEVIYANNKIISIKKLSEAERIKNDH